MNRNEICPQLPQPDLIATTIPGMKRAVYYLHIAQVFKKDELFKRKKKHYLYFINNMAEFAGIHTRLFCALVLLFSDPWVTSGHCVQASDKSLVLQDKVSPWSDPARLFPC